jgi:hypothetical protein
MPDLLLPTMHDHNHPTGATDHMRLEPAFRESNKKEAGTMTSLYLLSNLGWADTTQFEPEADPLSA